MRHLKSCAGFRDVVASIGCRTVYWGALLLIQMQRALARRPRTLAYFNLSLVNMRRHLG
jgi:hypothetical protein